MAWPRSVRGRLRAPGALVALVAMAAMAAVVAVPARANAEDSPYCRKVRARASADAALLFAPSVVAQGIKFPENRSTDGGVTVGRDVQFRAGVAVGPLDIYKGTQVKAAGEADCRQHEALEAALEVLATGSDAARIPALRRAVAFLDEREEERRQIVAKTDERLAARAITLVEASEVHKRVSSLLRKRAQLASEVRRLEQRVGPKAAAPLGQLVGRAESAAMDFERQVSHVRSLDPWTVQVTGGIIPQEQPVDYFGMVTLGFNFGAFSRNANETSYLDARAEELRTARSGLGARARTMTKDVAEAARAVREERNATDEESRRLAEGRATLERSGTEAALHTLAVLTLEHQLVEADRVFQGALADELTRMEEKNDVRR
jgi:hypothetical protein